MAQATERSVAMPKMTKETAQQVGAGPVDVLEQDLDGGYTANVLSFAADVDMTPLLQGLPDDRCPCPHWGYVLRGRMVFAYADHEETYEAGDAFYAPPGHVPKIDAGTEYVQFSPTDGVKVVGETIERNLARMLQT
jgi:hypothetical protein